MGRNFPKTANDTHWAQIEIANADFIKKNRGHADKLLTLLAIIYILQNYSSKEHPKSAADIKEMLMGMMGIELPENKDRAIRNNLQALLWVTNTDTFYGDEDYSCRAFRKQLGGRVLRTGSNAVWVYYFQRDYDERDIDIIRSFADDDKNIISDFLNGQDKEYVRMLCDMYAPERNPALEVEKLQLLFMEKGDKIFRHVGDVGKPGVNSFFMNYHKVYEAIQNQTPLTIQSRIKAEERMKGIDGVCTLIPDRLIWIDNKLYVKGKLYDTLESEKIRIADILKIEEIEKN